MALFWSEPALDLTKNLAAKPRRRNASVCRRSLYAEPPFLEGLQNIATQDMSRFEVLKGNLPSLLINLVTIWFTAGFVEKYLWRGYLMNRLADFSGQCKTGWVIALFLCPIIFGLAPYCEGTTGMIKTGIIGMVLGVSFLAEKRNNWPLVIAHAPIDALDFIGHFMET